jgi:GNAT superfamily N-acetyltransferase
MKLTYRKANVGDVPALDILMSELMSDLFGKNNRARMEQVVAEMQQDARYYLAVACEGEQVVGTAMGVLCHDLCGECRPFMVIENVIVSQACRGKGVGRGLLQELERWGCAQGCTYIDLVSSAFRTQAHRFYEAMGYSREGGFRKNL